MSNAASSKRHQFLLFADNLNVLVYQFTNDCIHIIFISDKILTMVTMGEVMVVMAL